MDVVENTLSVDLDAFLARPLFAHLATNSPDGPRESPVWYLWEDERVWVVGSREHDTFPGRVEADPRCALGVVDFDRREGRVEHVGIRGRGSVEPHDPDRAVRLLRRYLGPDRATWDAERFGDPAEWPDHMVLVRVTPETVVARDQSYSVAWDG